MFSLLTASILRETASFDPSSLLAVSDQLESLPSTAETRVRRRHIRPRAELELTLRSSLVLQSEDHSYAATVALRLALDEFKADLTMSSLTESSTSCSIANARPLNYQTLAHLLRCPIAEWLPGEPMERRGHGCALGNPRRAGGRGYSAAPAR